MTSLFDFSRDSSPVPKVVFTHGELPPGDAWLQRSKLRKPISAILTQPWTSSVDLLMSAHLHAKSWSLIESQLPPLEYCRVFMPLSALLEGDFFNKYIKTGDIEMLSEGRAGVDSKFKLRNGVLSLDISKDLYERAGLPGKVVPDGGRKHKKSRYCIELNLREPSMVHGKKGFERIVWAFNNVLNHTVTWLFHNAEAANGPPDESQPISAHQPFFKACKPTVSNLADAIVPKLSLKSSVAHSTEANEDAIDILEWLSLVSLDSPRIRSGDSIDPFLSRYAVPYKETASKQDLVNLRWRGFVPARWLEQLFVSTVSVSMSDPESWLALTATGFEGSANEPRNGYSVLIPPCYGKPAAIVSGEGSQARRHYFLWEMVSSVDAR